MKRLTLLFITTLLVLSCKDDDNTTSNPLDQTQTSIVDEINQKAIPFTDSDLIRPDSELASLDFVSNAGIVGLGEASHGAKDFFQMKHRIFKYLVEKFNYKAFAFEMDYGEAMIFDDYIQGKNTDDLENTMKTKMIFWTWRTKEVQELLEWMKAYNQGKDEASRIHFYGFDCQFPNYNADVLTKLISKADPSLSSSFGSPLTQFKNLNAQGDDTDYTALKQKLEGIYQTISDKKDELIRKGLSANEYEQAKQLARIIVQTQEVIRGYKVSEYSLRDKYMAENAQWLSTFTKAKICLWAHNFHIGNDTQNKSMGSYIAENLGDDYKRIGFGFSTGKFNASDSYFVKVNELTQEPKQSSTNYLFRHSQTTNFILRLDQLQDASSPLTTWVTNYHDFVTVGSVFVGDPNNYYNRVKLQQFFDVMIYFDVITNSELL